MADPGPIINTVAAPYFNEFLRLDGVVTLVDAKHVERRLDAEVGEEFVNEAVQQIAYADRIILNKTDLVGLRV